MKHQKIKHMLAGGIILSLLFGTLAPCGAADAAGKKPKLSKTSIVLENSKKKKVTVKNVAAKKIKSLSVKSVKPKVAAANKSGKTAVVVTGKKECST